MFEHCETLSQLNSERIRLSQTHSLVEVNNAYNVRRAEILQAKQTEFIKLTPVFVTLPQPVKYMGIPIAGRAQKPNTISLTPKGFLY